jgi:DNA-binding response OmpR family regulator
VRHHRILCVEDDKSASGLIAEVLNDEGFDVTIAETGQDALALLDQKFALILCDINLPDVSGMDVLGEVRKRRFATPFVFVTALSQRAHHIHARQLGCDDYVTKPIDFELLIAIVRHRLASVDQDQGETLIADFKLTDRELEVMTWAARGKFSSDISVLLGVSERTVNFHMDNAMKKMRVGTRVQAAVKCVMLGIIKP